MKLRLATMTFVSVLSASANACWNDSECPNEKVCECPSTSPTGNCSSVGQCIPDGRDWSSLKSNLNKLQYSTSILKPDTKEIRKSGNTIEAVTMKIDGRTGDPQPQFFTKKVNGVIVSFFGLKCQPVIGGRVLVTGAGTDIAVMEIRASGYPGNFTSTCSFNVIH